MKINKRLTFFDIDFLVQEQMLDGEYLSISLDLVLILIQVDVV